MTIELTKDFSITKAGAQEGSSFWSLENLYPVTGFNLRCVEKLGNGLCEKLKDQSVSICAKASLLIAGTAVVMISEGAIFPITAVTDTLAVVPFKFASRAIEMAKDRMQRRLPPIVEFDNQP